MNINSISDIDIIATCFKLSLKNGSVLGFTDADIEIKVDGLLYNPKSAMEKSNIEYNIDLDVDNLTVTGIIESSIINETELIGGLYNNAEIEIFSVNCTKDPLQIVKILKKGFIHEIKVAGGKFYAEIHSTGFQLEKTVCSLYSPTCRATLGDNRCKVNLSSYTKISTITDIIDRTSFIDSNLNEIDHHYNYGKIQFINGKNAGISTSIKLHHKNKITLNTKIPYALSIGDKYRISPGCDKNFTTCSSKFKNSINFRGEPHVPNGI